MNNKKLIFIIFLLFIFSRIIIYFSGIHPNLLFGYWQTLDYILLSQDLIRSLIYLHSEPVLWNFFLGYHKNFQRKFKICCLFFLLLPCYIIFFYNLLFNTHRRLF